MIANKKSGYTCISLHEIWSLKEPIHLSTGRYSTGPSSASWSSCSRDGRLPALSSLITCGSEYQKMFKKETLRCVPQTRDKTNVHHTTQTVHFWINVRTAIIHRLFIWASMMIPTSRLAQWSQVPRFPCFWNNLIIALIQLGLFLN